MTEIRYKKNNKNKVKVIIISSIILMLSASILFLVVPISQFIKIILYLTLILSVFRLFSALNNITTILINEKGIQSRINGPNFVDWKYIDGFEINTGPNARFIAVLINDHEGLLNQMNSISKRLMSSNIKRLGSPILIPEAEVNKSLEEVITELESFKNSLTKT